MLNVSTALPTLAPPGTPAPAKLAGGDFQDILGGLVVTPVADPLLAVPVVKVALPDLCAVAPAGPATTVIPDTGEIAAPTAMTLVATVRTLTTRGEAVPTMAPVSDAVLEPLPTAPPETKPETKPAPPVSLLPVLPTKRQALAEGGKPLPDDVADDDPSEDVLWLPTALPQLVPAPAAPPLASPKASAPIVSVVSPAPVQAAATTVAAVAAGIDQPDGPDTRAPAQVGGPSAPTPLPAEAAASSGGAIEPSLPPPNWAPASAGGVADKEAPTVLAKTDAPTVALPVTAKPDLPVRFDNTNAATTQPVPLQQAPLQPAPAILPAGQAFAAAIAAAVQQGRDEREASEPHTPIALATATLERLHAPAVAATPDARQGALDLRQDSGLQGMIDHIEVLRDGANAGDTRIRLIPDALGAVDVSVRRDGERLHVHFNTENQASARLIADAQPRLAELADARGVKLGQTSVDSGDGQQHRQQPATPIQFTRPAPVADSTETPDDLRVA